MHEERMKEFELGAINHYRGNSSCRITLYILHLLVFILSCQLKEMFQLVAFRTARLFKAGKICWFMTMTYLKL